jgi:hypothetical protein
MNESCEMQYMALLYVEADANADPPSAAGMALWMEFNQIAEAVGANTAGEPLQSTSTATPVRVRDGEMFRNAAWYYPDPKEAAENIRDYAAFYVPPVTVEQ